MAVEVIPVFPLDHVLMPGSGLPLRIFEPRYRQLLADVTGPDGARRFGVISVVSGSEVVTDLVYEPPVTAAVGTVAEILEVDTQPDGTSAVLTVGSTRFQLLELVDGDTPYLTARVSVLDEPIGELPDGLVETARAHALEYLRLISTLTRLEPDVEPYPRDPVSLSYRLAAEAPLPTADRQLLLEAPSAADRLRTLARVLRREVVLLRETRSVAVSPAALREALGLN